MEVQVNVLQLNGDKIDGEYNGVKWIGWSDGITTWKPFRIPYGAATNPVYNDSDMQYDLAKYAEGVGLTGWDWKSKLSRYMAYDFDAITGHSERHTKKLSDVELKDLRDSISAIPWVTIRKSTSGSGLHLYVTLDPPVETKTHTEHAALARSILGVMSAITNQNLSAKVDACGSNIWIWHRKMFGTDGLTLIKQGVSLDKVPANWKDHLEVIAGKRRRVAPSFVREAMGEGYDKLFEELTGQRSTVTLDEEHKKLIKYLDDLDFTTWWDADNHMLVTHTYGLKQAHNELHLRGIYDTLSNGTDATHNCFCYPLKSGGWTVRRYTKGVAESKTWTQDKAGWTKCYFNRDADLKTVAVSNNAVEHTSGGFVFGEAEIAERALLSLGADLKLPAWMCNRPVKVKEAKDGRLHVEINHGDNDTAKDMNGWLLEKGKWKRVVEVKTAPVSEAEIGNYDDTLRHIASEAGEDCGWVIKTKDTWHSEPISHISLALEALGLDRNEVRSVQGASIINCWTLVNRPFEPEYIGDRQWNRDAPQFKYPPSEDKDNLKYPTWNLILNHVGNSLNSYMKDNSWAKDNGITTGAEYLKCWIASVFQRPTEPLPYLFLYGPQNSGKSIFHEALYLLVTSGVVRADHALSDTQFNGELANAVICIIEETDLGTGKSKTAYNKIKDWVNSRQLPIRKLYETPYSVVNTTHWIQCTNNQNAVPIFPGDTRITMIYVPELPPEALIPKRDMINRLTKEAPDFLAAVLNLDLPICNDRLGIPVITTADKMDAENMNKSMLEGFIDEKCQHAPGYMILYSEFFDAFRNWMDPNHVEQWSKIRVGKELDRNKYPKGRNPKDCQFNVGNMRWVGDTEPLELRRKLVVVDTKLYPEAL